MTLHEQSISNQKNERHATWKETAYWCNQWRLLAENAIAELEATVKAQAEQIETLTRHAKVDDIAFNSMNHFAVDAEMERDALLELRAQTTAAPPVIMPPPVDQDWQVSPADGPDWNPDHFIGGVERIERKNNMLIFHFRAGGQVCVNHGVTYVAPERH